MRAERPDAFSGGYEDEVERLSQELKQQVGRAKARISERYAKLIEPRSFEPRPKRKA